MSTHTLALLVLVGLLNTASDGRRVRAPEPGTTATKAAPTSGHAHGSHEAVKLTPEMLRQLGALHELFAKDHDMEKALENGYKFVGPGISDPELGGMGDHYSRDADDDFGRGDGTYALERPQ
jgi:hypothetical protein